MAAERPGRYLSDHEVVRIAILLEEGRSKRYVTNLLNVNQSTLSRAINRYHETGEYGRRAGQGRNRITTPVDDRWLRLTVLRVRNCTAKMLQNELALSRNVHISLQTVRNGLRRDDIRPRVVSTGPRLTIELQDFSLPGNVQIGVFQNGRMFSFPTSPGSV
ncbi:hypothetical protein HHI36_006065 [Cryptolaemus montrouzieri]|uniref:Transposase IS30-like HTH domain-containing protein n=1 Tax=Cryptolaemus montrouzieri TaxID=559131 RepID=A0ABD2NW32_9CUCU